MKRTITAFAACMLALTALASASFSITPTSVTLSGGQVSKFIQIKNTGTTPLRYEARGFAWRQSLGGTMEMTASADIVVYPTLFTLLPGQVQAVRVAVLNQHPGVETAYRLRIKEIPDQTQSPEGRTGVGVAEGATVPVWVGGGDAKPSIEQAQITGRTLRIRVANNGAGHMSVSTIHVALMRDGKTVFEDDQRGWYILADSAQDFAFRLPAKACGKRVDVRLALVGQDDLQKAMDVTGAGCP